MAAEAGEDKPSKEAKKSKKYVYTTAAAILCSVIFITATGFLAKQMGQAKEQIMKLESALIKSQADLTTKTETSSTSTSTTTTTTKATTVKPETVCTSKKCVAAAGQVIDAMDESADPCEDFYQFACGGWMEKNPIPLTRTSWNRFGVLRDRVQHILKGIVSAKGSVNDAAAVNSTKDMFQACLNTSRIEEMGLEPLVQLLASFGHWPAIFTSWTAESSDWRNLSASMTGSLSRYYLLQVFNFADIFNDPDINVMFIDTPSMILPNHVYLNATVERNAAILDAYSVFAIDVAKAIRDEIKSKATDSQIARDVQQIIDFETKLVDILQSKSSGRRWDDAANRTFHLDELQNATDEISPQFFNWTRYLNQVYSYVQIEVGDDEKLIVMEPEYVLNLMSLLRRTTPRIITNYLHWRLVLDFLPETNEKLLKFQKEFRAVLNGPEPPTPRWRTCLSKINEPLGFALSAKMIEKTFDEDAKAQMEVMIEHLKDAFDSMVEEADWIDEDTKNIVKEKAAAMKHLIAYPDWIMDNEILDEYYNGLEIEAGSHFENVVRLLEFLGHQERSLLHSQTDRTSWITFPHVVNAFFASIFNSISFPAGILQPPFFANGRPAAMNYGAIGVVIGHEVTHGFDSNGRKRDYKGRLVTWGKNETTEQFLKRAECFVQQYENYDVPELAESDLTHLNGTKTLGENIADNGGIREAFRAYQNYVKINGPEPRLPGLEKYTSEQLFFISYAQIWCHNSTPESLKNQILRGVHSPGRYRVRGPLSNSKDFAEHFKCPPGPMNSAEKCVIW